LPPPPSPRTAAYEAVRKMTKLAALERKADALLPVGGWEGVAVDTT
jgi:hypothetical protein